LVSNISDVISKVISDINKVLPDDLSEYEQRMISDSLEIPYKSVTNSKVVLSDRIDEAIKCKSDLNYIIMKLKNKRKEVSIPYNVKYNKLFTILTRQGRPSRAAIESEINYTNPDMAQSYNTIENLDDIISFLESHLSLIDMVIRNYENRRYNL